MCVLCGMCVVGIEGWVIYYDDCFVKVLDDVFCILVVVFDLCCCVVDVGSIVSLCGWYVVCMWCLCGKVGL